jgi:hypothetical protein
MTGNHMRWPIGAYPLRNVRPPLRGLIVVEAMVGDVKALFCVPDHEAESLTSSQRRALWTRNVATMTGFCPGCSEHSGIDLEQLRVGESVTAAFQHESWCPAIGKDARRAHDRLYEEG